eukprot:TRINITY_DN58_c1_g1_i1.p1 TRINITY_DN58_c1_g1~~TRINITY_DN58_c1_g1_i1.p1  ORF type:complete len:299 (-),score=66.53 TRINITY_DN58_c1_g1_i1:39-935(-)
MWKVVEDTISGGVGGMSLVITGHPLDTIKVRMQTMVVVPGQPPPYKSTLDCAMQSIRSGGFFSLYRGMLAPLVGVTPMYMICFLGYGVGKQIFTTDECYKNPSGNNLVKIGLAGATSGIFTTPVLAPLERIKCILQIQENAIKAGTQVTQYKGATDCGLSIYRNGGIGALYRGFWSTMARDCVASFFYFSTYAFLKHHLSSADGSTSVLATLFAGGCAGVTNWLGCIPIDTLKSKYQTAPDGKYPNGIRDVFRDVVRNEGYGALYRGIGPTMIRAFPANAACFLGVETALKALAYFKN